MESDWTVACAADDPFVVVPWSNADTSLRYIDLRVDPQAIGEIEEARKFPAIAAALRCWNSAGAAMFTVKCDVWNYPAKLFDAFDLNGFAHAHASYVDLVSTDQKVFASFTACERLLRDGTQATQDVEGENARCEWVLRPAQMFGTDSDPALNGFAVTLYVWGYGANPQEAEAACSIALRGIIEPVARTMELS
jgi:hypothetical protein